MRIDFPYPGYQNIAPAKVPDGNLMGIFAPRNSTGNRRETSARRRFGLSVRRSAPA